MGASVTWWTDDSTLPDPLGKGARAVSFIQKLKLHEGKLAGQRFKLARWQERIVRRIYGDTREDGQRRIRTVFILLPRGTARPPSRLAWGCSIWSAPRRRPVDR